MAERHMAPLIDDTAPASLHYPMPGRDAYRMRTDRLYRAVSDEVYLLDVYQPARPQPPHPAVVLVHGQARPDLVRDAKSWPALQGLARVLAAGGRVAVVPNLGSTARGPGLVADNMVAAVRHVEAHAAELGVDPRRLALWVAAEGGLYGLGPALGGELDGAIRCAVALYPQLSDRPLLRTYPPLSAGVRERLGPSGHVRRRGRKLFPLLVVRAGQDRAEVNQALDEFVNLAQQVEVPVTLIRHDEGHHGFEVVDATDATRAVLDRAFAFLERYL
jgi:dienelactone hydrolase